MQKELVRQAAACCLAGSTRQALVCMGTLVLQMEWQSVVRAEAARRAVLHTLVAQSSLAQYSIRGKFSI